MLSSVIISRIYNKKSYRRPYIRRGLIGCVFLVQRLMGLLLGDLSVGGRICGGLRSDSYKRNEWVSPGDTQQRSVWGGSAPSSNPLPVNNPFLTEKVPLSYTFYWQLWYPFHIPYLELFIPLTAVYTCSLKKVSLSGEVHCIGHFREYFKCNESCFEKKRSSFGSDIDLGRVEPISWIRPKSNDKPGSARSLVDLDQ